MGEKFGNYRETGEITSSKKTENNHQSFDVKVPAKKYVEYRIQQGIPEQEYNELLRNIQSMVSKQEQQKKSLKESLISPVHKETKEKLNKEAFIHEAKKLLYTHTGINENQGKNGSLENFLKGIIDELVIGNYELAVEIYESNGKILLESIKQLASWEGLKQIATGLGENVWDLFDGNAYAKGKSVAELGLIGTGVGVGWNIGKKGVKLSMRHMVKERMLDSPQLQGAIRETSKKVEMLLPKKNFDFEKMLTEDIAKLGNKGRIEAGEWYLKRKLTPEEQKAILRSHEVGKTRLGGGVGNYTWEELKAKDDILKDVGFSQAERRKLLEKGVCGKIPEGGANLPPGKKEIGDAKAKDLTDVLDMKGTYMLSKIEGLKVMEAKEKMERFSDAIDVAYLINHPRRIDDMLDIVESMCDYIEANKVNIQKLSLRDKRDFMYVFGELRRNISSIENNTKLKKAYRDDISEIKNISLKKAYYILNPTLSIKN